MPPKAEIRNCQNCKADFTIAPEDFEYYKRIAVPPPTFCPTCRFQRRLAFMNVFNLYKRKCDLCKQDSMSVYHPDAPYVVYCPKCWWGDGWDPFAFGRDYDFSRPFFEQFREHWQKTPVLGLSIDVPTMATSPYTNHTGGLKNCYLIFHADQSDAANYGFYVVDTEDMLDCSLAMDSELCYDSRNIFADARIIGSENTVESMASSFMRDAKNCNDCFGCANLHDKKNYFFNEPLSREEYQKRVKAIDLGSHKTYTEMKAKAREHWKKYPPRPIWMDFSTKDTTGNYVFQSKNCKECYEVVKAEDSKFLAMIVPPGGVWDCYDITSWGNDMELCYECSNVGEKVAQMKFCQESGINAIDAEYCKLTTGGGHHFACVSAKKGEYVIFNKKYSKEEYGKMVKKIKAHMDEMPFTDKAGRVYKYGEFFPIELSPFPYNQTIANNFFPLKKQEAEDKGYGYAVRPRLEGKATLQAADLPDHIKEAKDDILKEVIACAKCNRGYKIIPSELAFLRRFNLPLPRECPFCRIGEKYDAWVSQMQLNTRKCSKCGTDFETPYKEKDWPTIYCHPCYKEAFGK